VDQPEGAEDMLGEAISKAGEGPGLPATALPAGLLEAGIQPGLAGLAGRKLFLEFDQLLSDFLTKITNTLRPIKPNIKYKLIEINSN
jgi:hypothetical protein